jgi:probable rRNA maturation factor
VRARLSKILAAEGLRNAEVSVLFVGDGMMRSLNRRYRRKDRTTDVLSFAFREGSGPKVAHQFLGDIVISVPVAERQAREAGETLRNTLDRLLVHGLLHLLGYDHERGGTDARRMEARERRLLEVLAR